MLNLHLPELRRCFFIKCIDIHEKIYFLQETYPDSTNNCFGCILHPKEKIDVPAGG